MKSGESAMHLTSLLQKIIYLRVKNKSTNIRSTEHLFFNMWKQMRSHIRIVGVEPVRHIITIESNLWIGVLFKTE